MHFDNVKIIRIVDGDTLDVEIDLGFSIKIKQRLRLSGVNTNELHATDASLRESANRAKLFMEDALIGKDNVSIFTTKPEKYGRYLAEVFLKEQDGSFTSVNDMLLDNGLAQVYV